MSELEMIWNEVVNMLDLDLNNLQLQYWINPLKPVYLKGNYFVLDATSDFIRNMVKRQYLPLIKKYISYICQKDIEIVLIDPSQDDYYLILNKYRKEQDDNKNNSILPDFSKKPVACSSSNNSSSNDTESNNTDIEDNKNNSSNFNSDSEKYYNFNKNGNNIIQNYIYNDIDNDDNISKTAAKRIEEKKELLNKQRDKNGYRTLNPKYTMDSFVRGKSNDFAYATAKAVVSNPGYIYNPLFIYGLSGLGKTHLMQAIAHEILEKDPSKKVLYITSEKFMNEMISMIENGTNQEKEKFRKKYRSIDVILIDDIQFIAGKKATMEEIFHTFNDLKEANKQIILSSDKPPKELKNLEERLVTRFEGGMTADIQKPDFETRVAILNHKMKGETISLPNYILEFISNNVTENIRELEGALLRVIAYFKYKQINAITAPKEEVMKITRDALKIEEKKEFIITINDVMRKVTNYYNLEENDLISKSRQNSIAFPRQVAMYLSRRLTNLSLVSIGQSFQRDHTTVMHAIDKINSEIKKNSELEKEITEICHELRGE